MSVPKIVVHTDVFVDHLCGDRQPSILREAIGKFFCYTTVFQAIELFSLTRTREEIQAIEDSMAALKLLGLNPKNAKRYGELIASTKRVNRWNLLTAGLCLESRLPLLTARARDFVGVRGLQIVSPSLVAKHATGAEILNAIRH